MNTNMPKLTDEQIALDAMRRIREKAWREGRNDALAVMKTMRAWANGKPMNQKELVSWMDSAIESFKENTDDK